MKKSGKSEEYIYNEKELDKYWGVCRQLKDKVLIGLTAFCGLRVSEAIHLTLEWVRSEEIHIPMTMPCNCWHCRKRGYFKVKSKAGARVIAIPGFLKPILAEYLKYQPEGLDFNRIAAWQKVRTLAKEAKLPPIFPHALRATAATQFAANGLTAVELCYIMGWARLEMGEHYIRIASARAGAKEKIKQIFPDR